MRATDTRALRWAAAIAASAAGAMGAAPAAPAASAGPARWQVSSAAEPTRFVPGGTDAYQVIATNVGGETTNGKVTISDTPPAGTKITAVYGEKAGGVRMNAGAAFAVGPNREEYSPSCPEAPYSSSVTCEYEHPVPPGDSLAIVVVVEVTAKQGETLAPNLATVTGGGADEAASAAPATPVVSETESKATPFGIAQLGAAMSTAAAGEHPDFTTSFMLNTVSTGFPAGLPRDIQVTLPAGLIGDPQAAPKCNVGSVETLECPPDTAVGVATTRIEGGAGYDSLIYNIVPYRGEPAAFDFQLALGIAKVRLDTAVVPDASAPGGYAVRILIPQINESEPLVSSSVTMWGDPSQFDAPGEYDSAGGQGVPVSFGAESESAGPLAKAFMRNPTSCAGPLALGLQTDSWQQPGFFSGATASLPGKESEGGLAFTGCEGLNALFTPTIEVQPDATTEANPGSHTYRPGAPSGYEVGLDVPQSELASTPATPDVKDVTLTMPSGVVASPSAANGLAACSEISFEPSSAEAAGCPERSQIGTLEIASPLLEEPLHGQVFLGEPECSPCSKADAARGRMVRLFLQAAYGHGAAEGRYVRIKLMGRTAIDQTTGQLTTTFEDNPQLPFSKLTLHLEGGSNAVLANPSTCGTATATATLTPWSGSAAEPAAARSSSSFRVEGCSASQFAPSFTAGTTATTRGGAYSPFLVRFGRTDRDQTLSALTVHTPPGLLGMVSHVTQCAEAQANAGTCPASSEIGSVSAAVGPGGNPYWITGGKAFLTGPYAGEPFGLSIVVPAVAGPFTLTGETGDHHEGHGSVVVRASIAVDPHTAALTIASNPMPSELDGIPLQVRTVDVNVNRPAFMRNATNCNPMAIKAQIFSDQGSSPTVAVPYQAKDCASLPFHPGFVVATKARHTRKGGAYLQVKVTSGAGQANIHEVHVSLPKQLPARNSTLKLACTETQFAADPAGCPAGSFVGSATAHTPVLSSPLAGPAIYVSHGGRSFPDLDIVLQGEGVTVILTGNTFIDKKGITTSTFKTVPDVPVSTFALTLPQSSHSALSGFGSFCKRMIVTKKQVKLRRKGRLVRNKGHIVFKAVKVKHKAKKRLTMPTTITGQNGAVIRRKTKIKVQGCAATSKGHHHKATPIAKGATRARVDEAQSSKL